MKRFGKKVYDGSNDVKREYIGTYICPMCKKESRLIRQKDMDFKIFFPFVKKSIPVWLPRNYMKNIRLEIELDIMKAHLGKIPFWD